MFGSNNIENMKMKKARADQKKFTCTCSIPTKYKVFCRTSHLPADSKKPTRKALPNFKWKYI